MSLKINKIEDSTKVSILINLNKNLKYNKPEEAKTYALQCINISENIGYKFGIASFLTTSEADYNAAVDGNWIEITQEEYNTLASSINEVAKVSTSDADYDLGMKGNIATKATTANNNGSTIPVDSYLFAFKYFFSLDGKENNQIKQSSAEIDNGYSDVGNTLPIHDTGERFFALKGSNTPVTDEGYLAFYQTTGMGYRSISGNTVHYAFTNTNTLTSAATPLYQGLSSTQKQWD